VVADNEDLVPQLVKQQPLMLQCVVCNAALSSVAEAVQHSLAGMHLRSQEGASLHMQHRPPFPQDLVVVGAKVVDAPGGQSKGLTLSDISRHVAQQHQHQHHQQQQQQLVRSTGPGSSGSCSRLSQQFKCSCLLTAMSSSSSSKVSWRAAAA
jgi:hypothetical protein